MTGKLDFYFCPYGQKYLGLNKCLGNKIRCGGKERDGAG